LRHFIPIIGFVSVISKTFKTILAWVTFVVAWAFFWGAAEAVFNYFWHPAGTWWGDLVYESAFRRAVFYVFALGVISALATVIALVVAGVVRVLSGKWIWEGARRWGAAAAAAALVTSNVGWLVIGLFRKGKVQIGDLVVNLREPAPFLEYWIAFVVLGVGLAVLLALRAAGKGWWRAAGKVLRPAGVVGFALLVAAHFAVPALRPVPRGPNIVFIILDAWRADAFRPDLMPKLSAYAEKNAVVYERTWSCAPWTYPSMSACFTGHYPDATRLWPRPTQDLHRTAASYLRRAGYDTGAVVGNVVLEHYTPITTGFDYFIYWDWRPRLRAIHFYSTDWCCAPVREKYLPRKQYRPETSRTITRLSRAFLRRSRRRPFFLWVHYMDPHAPYKPPPGYYDPADEKYIVDHRPNIKSRGPAYHRLYEGECAFLDDLLEKVLADIPNPDNTVVIITADHGEEFWEHYTHGHGKSVYETVTRVPLIVAVPGEPPAVTRTPTSLIDVTPTLLRYAGLNVPANMPGKPLAGTPPDSQEKLIFVGSDYTDRPDYEPPRMDAVILWPWKLSLNHWKMDAPGEYYNLEQDPGERDPLPEDDTARALREKLKAWKKAVKPKGEKAGVAADFADASDLRALGYVQ
jgi:arylsulfatase A-like enzyme